MTQNINRDNIYIIPYALRRYNLSECKTYERTFGNVLIHHFGTFHRLNHAIKIVDHVILAHDRIFQDIINKVF